MCLFLRRCMKTCYSSCVWRHQWFVKPAALFTCLQQECEQHRESMHPIKMSTLVNENAWWRCTSKWWKDREIFFFSYLQGCVVIRHEDAARLQQKMQLAVSQSWHMHEPKTLLGVIEILFYLFIFLSAAVISGYTVQMNLRLPLWSIMQCHFFWGLLMRSSASFGSTMEIISLFFFCLKGNAVSLIKLGSKLVLQLSVEKQSRAMEPSKCQRIITD